MSRPLRRPRARLQLPPLDAREATALVALCERLITAIWRTHGDAMAAYSEPLLEPKANRLAPKPWRPTPAAPPKDPPLSHDDDCF